MAKTATHITVDGERYDLQDKELAQDVSDLKSVLKKSVNNIEPYDIKANKYFAPGNTVSLVDFGYTNTKLYLISEDSWVEISGKFKGNMNNIVILNDTSLSSYFAVVLRVPSSNTSQEVDYKIFVPANKVIGISNWYENEVYVNIQNVTDFIPVSRELSDCIYQTDIQMPRYKSYYGYIDPNGAIVRAGNYNFYLYPVNVGDICFVETDIKGGLIYACFFDNALSQVGDKLVCSQNESIQHYSGTIIAPTTAKYTAITEIDGQQTLVKIKSRITKLEESTEQLSENSAMIPVTPTVQTGKYIDRDGNIQSMSTYSIYSYAITNDNYVNVSGVTKGFITVVSIWRDNVLVNKVLVSNDNTNDTPFDETLYLTEGDEVRITQLVSLGVPSFTVMNGSISTVIHENGGQQEIYGKAIAPVISGASKTDDFDIAGKTINIVGDSMTAMGNSYIANYVASKLNCTVRGYGYAGSAITYSPTEQYPSFVERIVDEGGTYNYQDADVWVIWGGYNDYNSDVEIGGLNSTSNSTLYGALKTIIHTLQSKLNMPSIIFITPCRVNRESKKMYEIVTAMTAISRNYGVPILNLYNESGLSANNFRTLTDDGLHLNELGRNMVYSKIAKFIKNNV